MIGFVYLVGAGPGYADAISLRAQNLLARADEVLYDYLVNPDILAHTAPDADCICLGRHGRASLWKPAEIQSRMVESARQGKVVVRLKSGDPLVFGRAAGEIAALKAAEIPFEIVPGITAAMAAPSFAGIPVTDREHASAVAFVTGQEDPSKPDLQLDFEALARFPGTLVFYMGITTAGDWTTRLMEHGAAPDLPVALVRRCGWPNQQVLRCRLDEVVERVTPYQKFPPPVIAIVGRVAGQTEAACDWFSQRPLFGETVLVSRPHRQAVPLQQELTELGADVVLQPAVTVEPVAFDIAAAVISLASAGAVIFTSANGVENFIGPIWDQGDDVRVLAGVRLIAIGPATARALAKYHLRCDEMPSDGQYDSEALVELFSRCGEAGNQSKNETLIVRGEVGRDVLAPALREQGEVVRELVVYRTAPVTTLEDNVRERLEENENPWALATSAAIAGQTVRLLGADLASQCRWVAISERTADALRKLGIEPTVTSGHATIEAMITALRAAVEGNH